MGTVLLALSSGVKSAKQVHAAVFDEQPLHLSGVHEPKQSSNHNSSIPQPPDEKLKNMDEVGKQHKKGILPEKHALFLYMAGESRIRTSTT